MQYESRVKILIAVILALIAVGPSWAERTWSKQHYLFEDPELGVVVEYTTISSDTEIP